MKKLLALLLIAVLMFAVAACDTEGSGEALADRDWSVPYGTLTYGTSTTINNDMFSGWTNQSPNAYIKALIHGGCDTIEFDEGSNFFVNDKVTKELTSVVNDDGSKTYTMTIWDDLVWNDGTPITAKDYVFSVLFTSHPAYAECGANALGGYELVGFEDYNAGETDVFTGAHLIDEYTFSITINPEELPFYWDITYASWGPRPMHVIAPGCDIADDGEGAYITGKFDYELLEKTVLDPQTGYRYFPQVTCGPYNLVSFDSGNMVAVLERNMLFKGTWDDAALNIERIIFRYVDAAIQVNALEAGEVDILTGLGGIVYLDPAFDLVERGLVDYHNYPRNGYGYLKIHCDQSPTQFVNVRQAMIYLIDRDEFVRQYSGGYAICVDGNYSQSMYIYMENKEWFEDNLTHYTYNPEKAVELLEEDGWVLNATGGTFVPGVDPIRYKSVDGELMPLRIEWLSSDNAVSQNLRVLWIPAAAEVGMEIIETKVQSVIDAGSRNGIRDDEAEYFVFNMGLNFGIPNSPWLSYSKDPVFWGGNYNNNFIIDDELDRLVNAMRLTEPGDKETYDDLWLQVIKKVNELVPDIWLYSDNYHDFYIPNLKNMKTNPVWSFAYAVQRAYLE